ncbi:hypothetical protein CCR75_009719 [Bremia lactucae]|uniref:Uncharacterized protein n=1 Tax=Bremia lactucae TaxID=4779 RepID=A0A976FM86_BRELC|nr:hypothetical protein CCR75_009719 [Bremia lactucae]
MLRVMRMKIVQISTPAPKCMIVSYSMKQRYALTQDWKLTQDITSKQSIRQSQRLHKASYSYEKVMLVAKT